MSRKIAPLLPPSLSTTPSGAYYLPELYALYVTGPFTYNGIEYAIIPAKYGIKGRGTSDMYGKHMDNPNNIYIRKDPNSGKWFYTEVSRDGNNLINYFNAMKGNTSDEIINPILDEVVVTPQNNYEELSTWDENAPAASAYDPNSELVRPNIERLLYWDPVNKQIRDRQLSERLSSYTPYNFLSTIIPAHLVDPMNYLGAAGEYFRGNDNFFLNALSGNNNGIFSLSQGLENWAKEHPNWATAANLVGSAVTGKFIPKVPRLLSRGKVGSSINSTLEAVGNFANRSLNYATGITNRAAQYAANTTIGKPIATIGHNVLNNADNFAYQVYLRIPQSVKGAVYNVRDFATKIKPTSLIQNGIEGVTNLSLSRPAATGVGALYTLGSNAYDIGKDYFNNLGVDLFKLGNFTKYFPIVNVASEPVDFINKVKKADAAINDITDNGLTPENAYKTINTLSTGNTDKQS